MRFHLYRPTLILRFIRKAEVKLVYHFKYVQYVLINIHEHKEKLRHIQNIATLRALYYN